MKPLARRFGVTDSAIRSWVRGSRPVEKKLSEASARTGISLEWLKYGRGNGEAEIGKIAPRGNHHFEEHPPERFMEDEATYGDGKGGWTLVVAILAARLNSKQIAEALKEILDSDDIEEHVSKSVSQILVAAQLPKLNR